ncbi:MAG: peptide chain release factor-like protein [Myxococcota bacterium]
MSLRRPPQHPPPYDTSAEALERVTEVEPIVVGGPGGQHRNKTESGVRLFHPPSGLIITATERRSQHANKEVAFERLVEALKRLNYKPKPRTATKPTRSSQRRRVEDKKARGRVKASRGRARLDD